MYKATKKESEELILMHKYTQDQINALDVESDKVRRGIPIDFMAGIAVADYQTELQAIRKSQKRWWQFWK
jgi:hypothetical protein